MKAPVSRYDSEWKWPPKLFDALQVLKQGKSMILVGPNGCGKSSLIQHYLKSSIPMDQIVCCGGSMISLPGSIQDREMKHLTQSLDTCLQKQGHAVLYCVNDAQLRKTIPFLCSDWYRLHSKQIQFIAGTPFPFDLLYEFQQRLVIPAVHKYDIRVVEFYEVLHHSAFLKKDVDANGTDNDDENHSQAMDTSK